jgi:type IV secretory pathway VirB10-like protein
MPEEAKSIPPSQQPPEVKDQSVRPPGILPKNTQPLVIAGIALVMVGAIVFSGGSAPKSKAKPSPAVPAIVGPSQERIQEYRKELDEQARKLAAEQAQLAGQRQALGPNPTPAATGPATGASTYPPGYAAPAQPPEKDNIQNDRQRREYASLFASNVALSYRKDPNASSPTPASSTSRLITIPAPQNPMTPSSGYALPSQSEVAQSTHEVQPMNPSGQSEARTSSQEEANQQPSAAIEARVQQRDAEIDQSVGQKYRIFEGTVLESVLTNRLDGSFSGPVNCMLTANVYSHDGQHLLIPQGARALGEVKRVSNLGQDKLAVVFHRIIMPDGYSVSLDQFQGLNQIGETGLRDQVNHHYMQVFGVSLAIGAIAGLAQADTQQGLYTSSTDAYRQGFAESLSQSSLRILDRYLNILPTVTIREGHRVRIYLSDDLLLPAYENHRTPGDL